MTLQTDHKYVGMISSRLDQFKRKTDRLYNFRCPVCGDSQKNKHKARGYLFEHNGSMIFKCHNCDFSASLYKILEVVDPSLARSYKLETFGERGHSANPEPFIISHTDEPPVKPKKEIDIDLPLVTDLNKNHRAVGYLESRKIPRERWGDLYYTKNMKDLEYLNELYKGRLVADERIIIPFRDDEGTLIGVTGRSMGNSNLRYVTIRTKVDKPLVYVLNRLDYMRQIYVVEGQFHSMFIDNCIAPGGTDFNRAVKYLPKERVTLILDNQPRNKQVVKKIEYFCRYNFSMVIFPSTWNYKDINDAVVNGVSPSEIMQLLNTSTHQNLSLRLAIRDWKKC